jgi:hypothetical protein
MRLAAVFNVWVDCIELLPYAVENIRPVVDEIILVWSRKSNRGQIAEYELPPNCTLVNFEPVSKDAQVNECMKRNAGLEAVKTLNFTHFIMLDCDEFYDQNEFAKEKKYIRETGVIGTVCRIKTYFKSPTLTIGYDHTLVPFIHSVRRDLHYKLKFSKYPYAYDHSGTAHIDPTRRLNMTYGVKLIESVTMHHYSWVRKDFSLKMGNSSANFKTARTDMITNDLKNAAPGYFCQMYQRTLTQCENQFNLPEFI